MLVKLSLGLAGHAALGSGSHALGALAGHAKCLGWTSRDAGAAALVRGGAS